MAEESRASLMQEGGADLHNFEENDLMMASNLRDDLETDIIDHDYGDMALGEEHKGDTGDNILGGDPMQEHLDMTFKK